MTEHRRFQLEDYAGEAEFEPVFPDEETVELSTEEYKALFGIDFDVWEFVRGEFAGAWIFKYEEMVEKRSHPRLDIKLKGNIPLIEAEKVYRMRTTGDFGTDDTDLQVRLPNGEIITIESQRHGIRSPIAKNPETGIFYVGLNRSGRVVKWSMGNVADARRHINSQFP